MNKLKRIIYVLLSFFILIGSVYADTAKQIDFLLSGYRNPTTDQVLSGGKVWCFLDGTSTMSALYTDKDKSGTATNPVILDSSGKAEVYGNQIYKFEIYDSEDVLIETINGAEYITIENGFEDEISNMRINNISDLRAITFTPYENQKIDLLGYYSSGDGGGGQFYWDASNAESDNSCTIIKATAITTGRWERIYSGNIDVKWAGAVCNGSTNDSTAVENADAVGPIIITGPTRLSSNVTLTNTPVFINGGYFIVDSGDILTTPAPEDYDFHIFTINGTLTFSKINKPINYLWFKASSDTDADAVDKAIAVAGVLQEIRIQSKDASNTVNLNGVTVNKRVHFVGGGRLLNVTGSINITDGGLQAMFSNMSFSTPTSGALFDITGRGGMDFRDCQINPGTGNYVFSWDRDGLVPVIIEFMQCNVISGKLTNAIGTTPQTYEVHFKEGSLIDINEDEWLDADNGNYCKALMYDTLVSVGSGVTFIGTSGFSLMTARNSDIDDNADVFLTNGTATWDTIDVSMCTYSGASAARHEFLQSFYSGSGLSTDKYKTMITTGTLNLNADLGIDEYYYNGSGDVTLTGNVVYSISGGLYDGQEVTVYFIDRVIPGAFSCNFFGIVGAGATIDKNVFRLKYIDGNWEVYRIGDKSVF